MSFRELTMIDVKEVLRRWAVGQSARQMARDGVVSRGTATRYIEVAKSLGLSPSNELSDEVVRSVAQGVQARPTPAVSDPRQLLDARRIQIEKWLRQDEPLSPALNRPSRCACIRARCVMPITEPASSTINQRAWQQ